MPFHPFSPDTPGWHTEKDEPLFANDYLAVHRVTVTTPSRPRPFTWTVCHRKAAVVIAARTAGGAFLMIRQERVPIRATIWEFPAGQIDEATDHDEAAIQATGLRELREESGWMLSPEGTVRSLGHFFPSSGFTDEHSHLLLADPVVPHPEGHQHDESEAISECVAIAPGELTRMIATGEIRDANTLATYARLVSMGIIIPGVAQASSL